MTDQKPTGVFVRLPLSDEQVKKLEYRLGGYNDAILSIGTPMPANGLKTFLRAIVSGKSLVGILEPDSKREIPDVFDDIPLVRQSDAQAQIAARDAEIVRLNSELSGYRAGLSELVAKEVAENLKGGAA